MKRSLTQKLGLLGVVSFLSYTAAVVFAPLTYPGYNWMAQAVSDLSAANAPSLALWNQLSALYNACEVVCATVVCIGIQGQKTKLLRSGIYLFAIMEWISAVGYRMFPLSSSGYELHELTANRFLSKLFFTLSDEQKEVLYYLFVKQYSTTRLAAIREQSDRNIRKLRMTIQKKLQRHMYEHLSEKLEKDYSITLREREFVEE